MKENFIEIGFGFGFSLCDTLHEKKLFWLRKNLVLSTYSEEKWYQFGYDLRFKFKAIV